MGQCRNCGATIHEGDTFCRTCAMPVEDNLELSDNSRNVATNDFLNPTINSSQMMIPEESNPNLSNLFQNDSSNVDIKDNKQYVQQDGNDRTKATFFNFLQLAVLIAIIAIVIFFVYQLLF